MPPLDLPLALLLASVALLAWAGARLIIRWSGRLGLVDAPNHRSSHRRPTPRGGGAAIALAILVGAIAWPADAPAFDARAWAGLLAALLLGAVGLVDDLRGLGYRVRLLAQAATVAALFATTRIDLAIGFAGSPTGWLLIAIVAVAALWWINLFNFMDGIDGLAASQALFMFGAYLLCGFAGEGPGRDPTAVAISLLAIAATAGFLLLNRPPARIFMGDAGSLLLSASLLFVCCLAYQTVTNPCGSGRFRAECSHPMQA